MVLFPLTQCTNCVHLFQLDLLLMNSTFCRRQVQVRISNQISNGFLSFRKSNGGFKVLGKPAHRKYINVVDRLCHTSGIQNTCHFGYICARYLSLVRYYVRKIHHVCVSRRHQPPQLSK